MIDWTTAHWHKAVVSDTGGCVEVATTDGMVGVRDTKANGAGPVLEFTAHEWDCFLAGVASGEFTREALSR